MSEDITSSSTKRCAVVTGANKGIGYETCKQLASNGIMVVLTSRDKNRGNEALERLRELGLSDQNVIFHQLNVMDQASIAVLVDFIRTKFGKLDILVNNAGATGTAIADSDALKASLAAYRNEGCQIKWKEVLAQPYELAVDAIVTNYYGVKRMTEAFLPLLQLSNSPRIVNVSSIVGSLKNIPDRWAKALVYGAENLVEEKVEEVLSEYLKEFKDGCSREDQWRPRVSSYQISKASMNAYSRITAKRHPNIQINCLQPGYCRTDIAYNTGTLTAKEGAENIVHLALQPIDGPSGLFFDGKQNSSF